MRTIEREGYCFNAQVKEWNPSSSALQFDQYSSKLFLCSGKKYQNLLVFFNNRSAPQLRVLADEDECHKFELKSPTYTHFHQGGMFENHVLSKLTAMH